MILISPVIMVTDSDTVTLSDTGIITDTVITGTADMGNMVILIQLKVIIKKIHNYSQASFSRACFHWTFPGNLEIEDLSD